MSGSTISFDPDSFTRFAEFSVKAYSNRVTFQIKDTESGHVRQVRMDPAQAAAFAKALAAEVATLCSECGGDDHDVDLCGWEVMR